jgi:hypothetical protein
MKYRNNKSAKKTMNNKKSNIKSNKKSKTSARQKKTFKKTIGKHKQLKKISYYNKNKKGGHMRLCACVDYNNSNTTTNNQSKLNSSMMRGCQNEALDDSDFCAKHQNCKQFIQGLTSGYEHKYNPGDWSHPYIEGTHNCYTYFLNDKNKAVKDRCEELCHKHSKKCPSKVEQCSNLKPQPGDYYQLLTHGNLNKGDNKYTCPMMESRILSDNDMIKRVTYEQKCPQYYYKGAMVVDPGHTFHFYRQNEDGTWSHKPGTLPVSNKDASDKIIYVPHGADRNYNKENKKDGINYVDFCGYYCIPNNKYLNTHAI